MCRAFLCRENSTINARIASRTGSALGSASPMARTIAVVARAISRLAIASRIATLFGKYSYSVPTLIPARSAMRLVFSAARPSRSRIRAVASKITSTVSRERLCCGDLLFESATFFVRGIRSFRPRIRVGESELYSYNRRYETPAVRQPLSIDRHFLARMRARHRCRSQRDLEILSRSQQWGAWRSGVRTQASRWKAHRYLSRPLRKMGCNRHTEGRRRVSGSDPTGRRRLFQAQLHGKTPGRFPEQF